MMNKIKNYLSSAFAGVFFFSIILPYVNCSPKFFENLQTRNESELEIKCEEKNYPTTRPAEYKTDFHERSG